VRIVVAGPRVPGAGDTLEPHAGALVAELRQRGHDVETVGLPSSGAASAAARAEAAAWRLLDLSSAGGRTVDLLIATGFPAYFARHPSKVAWLARQPNVPPALAALDARMRGECARVFTNVLYDPPPLEQLLG
jgi:hypothetical protein